MTARMRDGAKDGDKSFSKLFDIIEEIAADDEDDSTEE